MGDFITVHVDVPQDNDKRYRITVTLKHWGLDKENVGFHYDTNAHTVTIVPEKGNLFQPETVNVPKRYDFSKIRAHWTSDRVYEIIIPLKIQTYPP